MNAEQLLKALLKKFFYEDKGGLYFSYKEMYSIGDIDKNLENELLKIKQEVNNIK